MAIHFVRSHLSVLGLKKSDLRTLRFRQDYVDTIGVHNLSWSQSVRGVPVFGNGLRVKVTRDGRVLSVQGSPVSGLAKLAAQAPTTSRVSASSARTAAARNVGGKPADVKVVASRGGTSPATVWANHDYAKKVWFLTASGLRPRGRRTSRPARAAPTSTSSTHATGAILFRRSTVDKADGDAYVYDNYPGAAKGGKARVVNLIKRGWLTKKSTFLNGNSVVTWDDLNDDNQVNPGETTQVPGNKKGATFPLKKFGKSVSASARPSSARGTRTPPILVEDQPSRPTPPRRSTWPATTTTTWPRPPIGFTARAGNFSAAGGDPVLLNALDGANTASGDARLQPHRQRQHEHPAGRHPADHADVPVALPGYVQRPGHDPFVPTSGAFDASILYHEYTHGLSNRLVIDADGNSSLNVDPGRLDG